MKKITKIMSLALTTVMTMSFAVCAHADSDKNITLVLSQRDEWLSTLVDAAEAAATEQGYNMNTVDCISDSSKAIQFVQTAKNAGEQVIIVNLVDPAQATAILEAAGDMKVVFVNRTPDDMGLLNQNAVYVGSNEMTSGKYQGEALVEYFKEKGYIIKDKFIPKVDYLEIIDKMEDL